MAVGDPGDGLDVAQAARARLDVRFELTESVVELGMTALLFGFLFGPPLINVLRKRQGKGFMTMERHTNAFDAAHRA